MSGRGQDYASMYAYDVLECYTRETPWGCALLVRIHRHDLKPMGWRELWGVLDEHYPDQWALQTFPERDALLDQANKYHLWVLPPGVRPAELDLMVAAP